jgi:hypothetical protein
MRLSLVVWLLLLWSMGSASSPAAGESAGASRRAGIYRGVLQPVRFDVSPPLRQIPPKPMRSYVEDQRYEDPPSGLEGPLGPQSFDPAVQNEVGDGTIPDPLLSFDGHSNLCGCSPPDPVGDVGPEHYVEMSNLHFEIFDKSGALVFGPVANNTLWSGFGGECEQDNAGDPIVLYDQFADRWILTQFTSSGPEFFNCVAVSTTGDPTGSYYRYAFSTGSNFPDYPKYGLWTDALYISTREFLGGSFDGVGAYAVNRAELLAGDPGAQVISFLVPPGTTPYEVGDGLLPADIDGNDLPPDGSPAYYVGSMDDGGPYGAPQDALTLWKFVANFADGPSSSFTLTDTIPITPYDTQYPCSPSSRHCIPEPTTTNKIDILSYRQRPLHRLAYRNFGSYEALVTNQSVEAATAPSRAGVRWWELRSPNSSPLVYQEGTYAPNDGIHRWMASVAMDRNGNLALGYSVSSLTAIGVFPGLRYTGRRISDPLGTLALGEGVLHTGTGSQTGSQRWGDYTSLNVDPVDDCTFWYVNEYVPVNSALGWRMRIGAFKLPLCGSTVLTGPADGATPGSVVRKYVGS